MVECWTGLLITAGGVLEGVVYWLGEWERGGLLWIVVIWEVEGALLWFKDVSWEVGEKYVELKMK